MDITVTAKGDTFAEVARRAGNQMRRANRAAGREIAKVGRSAIGKGAPRMMGRKLGAKTKVNSSSTKASVTFQAKPAGPWAIVEAGARPHPITPRNARALAFEGVFAAAVNHPGTNGHKAWTKAGERLEKAIRPVIEDTYEEALDA